MWDGIRGQDGFWVGTIVGGLDTRALESLGRGLLPGSSSCVAELGIGVSGVWGVHPIFLEALLLGPFLKPPGWGWDIVAQTWL